MHRYDNPERMERGRPVWSLLLDSIPSSYSLCSVTRRRVSPTSTPEYVSFIDEKFTAEEDGVWTTGKVQCLYQGIYLPGHSCCICDLQCLLSYMDKHTNKRHKADATRSSTTIVGVRPLLIVIVSRIENAKETLRLGVNMFSTWGI
jgi:hypothetical protein